MKYNFTYKITNLINNKYYFGCHQTDNLLDGYFGSGMLLHRAIKKYGKSNFIIEWIENYSTKEKMFKAEKELITEDLILDKNCYNIKAGGYGGGIKGIKFSEESKKRMSLAQKGIKPSEESKKKMSISQKKRSKDTCEGTRKQSEIMSGRKVGNRNKWKDQNKYNNENIAKMADKIRGRTKDTHDGPKKQSDSMKGRKKEDYDYLMNVSKRQLGKTKLNNMYTLKRSIAKSKGFYITPFGTFYSSLDASILLGCTPQRVITACKINNSKVFTKNSFSQSSGIFTLFEDKIGKTYKEIGFYFAKFINKQQKTELLNQLT